MALSWLDLRPVIFRRATLKSAGSCGLRRDSCWPRVASWLYCSRSNHSAARSRGKPVFDRSSQLANSDRPFGVAQGVTKWTKRDSMRWWRWLSARMSSSGLRHAASTRGALGERDHSPGIGPETWALKHDPDFGLRRRRAMNPEADPPAWCWATAIGTAACIIAVFRGQVVGGPAGVY